MPAEPCSGARHGSGRDLPGPGGSSDSAGVLILLRGTLECVGQECVAFGEMGWFPKRALIASDQNATKSSGGGTKEAKAAPSFADGFAASLAMIILSELGCVSDI